VAESLYRGVARYEGGLSGTRTATERAAAAAALMALRQELLQTVAQVR